MLAIDSVRLSLTPVTLSSGHQSLHFVPLSTSLYPLTGWQLQSLVYNSHSCTKLQLFPYNLAYQRLLNPKIKLSNNKTIASGFHLNRSVDQVYFLLLSYCLCFFSSTSQ